MRVQGRWPLAKLKDEVLSLWEAVNEVTASISVATFKAEIRQYGDLRRLSTWQQAFAALRAKLYVDCHADDGQFLIEVQLIKAAPREGWKDLLAITLEQLCAIPEGWQALVDGMAAIARYGSGYGTTQDDLKELTRYVPRRLQAVEEGEAIQALQENATVSPSISSASPAHGTAALAA